MVNKKVSQLKPSKVFTLIMTSGRNAHSVHNTPVQSWRVEDLKPGDKFYPSMGSDMLLFMGTDNEDPVYGDVVVACRAQQPTINWQDLGMPQG